MSKEKFDSQDITDVRIILEVGDKHYALIPKQDLDREKVKLVRIELVKSLFNFHDVVFPALEDIKKPEKDE